MNNTLIKAIRETLNQWSNMNEEQKGPDFEVSVRRLTIWLNELENIHV